MGFSNQKILVNSGVFILITLCYLLPNELVNGRKISDNPLEKPKHKGTIKTIKTKNGEVIDCVDIYKQPAFDHPLLKNHKIEMWPNSLNLEMKNDEKDIFQTWNQNGESCPEGTIPILRSPKSNYPKKVPLKSRANSITNNGDDINEGHEYAQGGIKGGPYYGTSATFNVWQPYTFENEFSLAQTWVLAGQNQDTNSIEAGWIINHKGDNRTKFFSFWTSKNYENGCYDIECPGFIQVSKVITLGFPINPVSVYAGQQYAISITISKNKQSGHWWLIYQDKWAIGYWPGELFTKLKEGSNEIHWGGEIINKSYKTRHTTTQMGSGHFPNEGSNKASYISKIQYEDKDGAFWDAKDLDTYTSRSSCYDIKISNWNPNDKVWFYYGGPGYSDICQ